MRTTIKSQQFFSENNSENLTEAVNRTRAGMVSSENATSVLCENSLDHSKTSLSFQIPVNRKRSEHIYLRHLRVRRPKIRALLVLQKNCRVYDAAKWALDRLSVDTVDVAR